MIRKLFILIIIALMSMLSPGAMAQTSSPYPYVIILKEGEKLKLEMDDSTFYRISRKVAFPVGSSLIPEDHEFRQEYLNSVLPLLQRQDLELAGVMMRGAASPEGPVLYNQELASRRLSALVDLVTIGDSLKQQNAYKTSNVAEDYVGLLLLMKAANDPDYKRVAGIIDYYRPLGVAALKYRLMQLDGGTLFWRLRRTYFAELRAARIVLFFRPRKPEKDVPIEWAPEPIRNLGTVGRPTGKLIDQPLPEKEAKLKPVTLHLDTLLPRREFFSVKNNMLMDVMWMPGYNRFCPMPNIGVEYYPKDGQLTFAASIDFPWWKDYWAHKYFEVNNYIGEVRYYMQPGEAYLSPIGNGAAYQGLYASVYGNYTEYLLCFNANDGWIGEGFGGGVGLGYVVPMTKGGHWKLEFEVKFGFFATKYDPFQYECPVDPTEQDHLYYYKWTQDETLFKKRQHHSTYYGPTRVGITLSYDVLYRRRNRRGLSFKSTERLQVNRAIAGAQDAPVVPQPAE